MPTTGSQWLWPRVSIMDEAQARSPPASCRVTGSLTGLCSVGYFQVLDERRPQPVQKFIPEGCGLLFRLDRFAYRFPGRVGPTHGVNKILP